ncbi:hypothetical protein ACFQ51_52825 [Streptomyces kaempferi]
MTQTDVERWKTTAEQGDAMGRLNGIIEKQMSQGVAATSPPDVAA